MKDGKELLMITASGPDRPGILSALTSVFREHHVDLVDIEQTSLHDMLSLCLVLDMEKTLESKDSVIKDILFEGSHFNLKFDFSLFDPDDLQTLSQRNLYVLTHFGGMRVLAELSSVLAEENVNIETISTLTHHGIRSIEMILNASGLSNIGQVKQRIMKKSRELQIDLGLQKMEAYRKNKRMVFFDMDSTLVDMEVIDEMSRRANVYSQVARITEKAMRGDFDFTESLTQRVALLKGLKFEELQEIRDQIRLSEGVEELITTLKWLGYQLGIVTGGFDFFADHLKENLGFDFVYANSLEIKNGMLTGAVPGPIVDAAEKARLVNQTACDLGILLDQTVVVGDGANDALMLGQAGLGIAYNAKPKLDKVAHVSLGKTHLRNIFHLLGITEEDITEATSCKPS
jgi:phosphoserine phosphatase